jgi:hypothetical protein
MRLSVLLLSAIMVEPSTAFATTPQMLGVFGDGMVLQHDRPIIDGCGALPHANIAACVGNSSGPCGDEIVRIMADKIGCFSLPLAPRSVMKSAASKLVIEVKVSTGNASSPFFARARDVSYGHVILCAGQSNMVHPLSYVYNATAQIAAAALLPNLRLFVVGRQWSNEAGTNIPLNCTGGGEPPINPDCSVGFRNVWRSPTQGGAYGAASFSAVCYLTAQELMRTELGTDAAVGLVEADWGGSNMATWQSREVAVAHGCPGLVAPGDGCPMNVSTISPVRGNSWACLLHGMIQPLTLSLRPFLTLWYQGEANSGDVPSTYQCQLEAMIAEWRALFNSSSMPFFVVQLAPYWQKNVGSTYPAIRIAQAQATDNSMHSGPSGYAVTHDLGDIAGGIHPHNKTEVGRRLALEIRAKVFKTPNLPRIPAPLPGPVQVKSRPGLLADDPSSSFGIKFNDEVTKSPFGLVWSGTHNCTVCCNASTTEIVEVCSGNDCRNQNSIDWTVAAARWNQNEGELAVSVNATPGAVRYAWSNYPECLLFDGAGLPVGPFNRSVAGRVG